jgi:hypothetical protein
MTRPNRETERLNSARININRSDDVVRWTQELGVDERTLRQAVKECGPSLAAVQRHLQTSPPSQPPGQSRGRRFLFS